jgi:hypothetical protein
VTGIELSWSARDIPLPARAVAAWGEAARRLGERLAALDDAALGTLTAVAGNRVLIVIGDEAALPWIDGVSYLGRDDGAPELLLPTALEPSVPAPVLEAAIKRAATKGAPIAVLPTTGMLVPCGSARAIDRAVLATWIEGRTP